MKSVRVLIVVALLGSLGLAQTPKSQGRSTPVGVGFERLKSLGASGKERGMRMAVKFLQPHPSARSRTARF